MKQAGRWQHLQATVETPLHTASGQLWLERGFKDVETNIKLWLDDIELEFGTVAITTRILQMNLLAAVIARSRMDAHLLGSTSGYRSEHFAWN